MDTPRAGELTPGWRLVTGLLWIGVTAAFAAIWNTSERLGLSTWWLGPRGDPNLFAIRLLPFAAPGAMMIATANNLRRLGWLGIGAAIVSAAIGLGDLAREPKLAALELIVAGAALLVSVASLTGTYRHAPGAAADDAATANTTTASTPGDTSDNSTATAR